MRPTYNETKGLIKIFERKQIGSGVWFNRITDSRFKINKISVGFYTAFDDNGGLSRADFALVPYCLTDCCEKYPDYKSLSMRFAELYGASISDNVSFAGNRRYTSIAISTLDDRYALDGEKLERESCELLIECIRRPLAADGAFDANLVRLMKTELIDAIDSIINDKRSLAVRRAALTAFVGEPQENSVNGTHEEAEKVTPESAYAAYRHMLEHGHIEIFAVGCSDFSESEKLLTEAFGSIDRRDICELCAEPSVLKKVPADVTERMPMQQAVTRMYFKAPEMTDRYANMLFSMILGGMTTSRFFENIREKQSLCYYCSSFSDRLKRTLVANAGIEPQNVKRTQEAIINELNNIRENGVTDEELRKAKLEVMNDIKSLYDNVGSIGGWYLGQVTDGVFLSPEDYAEQIMAVTAERIREVSRLYTLDTVYTLCPEEVSND